jgi:hypothetical protein
LIFPVCKVNPRFANWEVTSYCLKIHLPDTDYGGLFGYTRNATIMDVKLVDADVEGQSSVGALIGYAESTDISRCSSDGTVSGQEYVVGGLVGEIDAGSLSFCSSFSIVSSYGISGGLVGAVSSGAVVSSCYATGEVRVEVRREGDGSSGGGLIGFSQGSSTDWVTVSSCYATGNVSTADDHAGGLIGYVDNTEIENCYASGDVSGTSYVGGLVGRAANNTVVTFSYATGAVTAEIGYAGGLVGCADKTTTTIRDSFAANGTIIFTGEDATPTFHRVAGFSYTNQLTNLYANVAMAVGNVTVTTESNASGVDGDSKSITEDFQSIAFFSDTQWTDADAWSTDVWTFSDDDYPHLNWEG